MDYFSHKFNIVAVGGCALGFVRDGDFIEWDNDIDLFAPIDSRNELDSFFSKALKIFPEDKTLKYYHGRNLL